MTESLVLAADAGGTKTNLALIPMLGRGRIGRPVALESYRSADYPSLEALIDDFRGKHGAPIDAVSIGFAGPVAEGHGVGTHVPWATDAKSLGLHLGISRAHVINDLVATAHGVAALTPEELEPLLPGVAAPDGNAAIVAAGTGLGETILLRHKGDLLPVPSEGGHADFAARTDPELEVFRALRTRFGRVSVERVLSGPGLVHIARVLHDQGEGGGGNAMSTHDRGADPELLPAEITSRALAGTCPWCVRTLELFVGVYGAEAGNIALRGLARSGVYLAGGIAPRIVPFLKTNTFRDAFLDKAPHRPLLESIPVWLVRNERTAVLGAARYATL